MLTVRHRRKTVALGVIAALAWGIGLLPRSIAPRAQAIFPGRNGGIAFSSLQGLCPDAGGARSLISTTGIAGDHLGCDYDIFSVAPNGSAIRRVSEGSDIDIQPAWSPDGRRLAFVRTDLLLTNSDIWVMERDGTGVTNLTPDYTVSDYQPAWSPDGGKILFSRRSPSGLVPPPAVTDIRMYIMNADGSDVTRLAGTPGIAGAGEWSPDGRWIVFGTCRETANTPGAGPLGLIRPDGSGHRTLEVPGGGACVPHWSPDGKSILYTAVSGDDPRDLWTIAPDGTGARNLTAGSESDHLFGVWSPDGKRIAFLSDRDGSYKLYTMRSDGSNVRKLIDLELNANEAGLDWGPRP
ncbi:MAG: TolB family protein [Actinomycetota bacterium]